MDDLETLKEKKAQKLLSEFLKRAAWIPDWDRAREESRLSGRPILGYFTLSHFTCLACLRNFAYWSTILATIVANASYVANMP